MPLDWLGEETEGGLWVAEMDALDFPMPHTHSCTHIWLVSCAFTSFKICINLVLKIYIYILCCPCYLTTFGQPMAGGEGEVAREEKEHSGSWNFEVSLPHAASVGVAVAVTVCAASKVLHFPTLHLFQCSKGSWSGVSCSCKLFVLFQVPNNLTTKILNFCLNCRQCALQLCVCGCMCPSGCVSSH